MTEPTESPLANVVDDKGLVIVCVTLLAMTSVWVNGLEGLPIVRDAIVGLVALAVGKALK